MKYLSLFSGVGGFDLGFDRAGMHCLAQCEQDKRALAVLNYHWSVPKIEDVRDVTKNTRINGSVDLICGGFPCQDVSTAGQRAGLAGSRSGLWFEFLRVIEEIEPLWVVIENVPGLLSSNRGRDMGTIIGGLAKCGYGWAYRVLDSQFFGVPQRRRRVFIVASLGSNAAQKVLFEPESSPWDTPPIRETREGVTQAAIRRAQTSSNGWGIKTDGTTGTLDQTGGDAIFNGLVPTLRGSGAGTARQLGKGGCEYYVLCPETPLSLTARANRPDPKSQTYIAFAQNMRDEVRYINGDGSITGALGANEGAKQRTYISQSLPMSARVDTGETTGTLLAQHETGKGGNEGRKILDNKRLVRRLTPLECERLQGFPDNWTKYGIDEQGSIIEISDTQRYKQCGNAVSVPVAKWIGQRIMAYEI